MKTTFHIKNMVCNRCIRVVGEELAASGLRVLDIQLGQATVEGDEASLDPVRIRKLLENNGFELLDDQKSQLIEKIKNTVVEQIHQKDSVDLHINWSYLIQEKVGMNYQSLSTLFSATEGITIEKYIIAQRIERVKEWLIYNQISLSEIAWKLGYSSVQHLSTQFKKATGMTPSEFKNLHNQHRNPLDMVGRKPG